MEWEEESLLDWISAFDQTSVHKLSQHVSISETLHWKRGCSSIAADLTSEVTRALFLSDVQATGHEIGEAFVSILESASNNCG